MNRQKYRKKTSAIHLHAVNQATIEQPVQLQGHACKNNVAIVESEYAYASVMANEQHQSQSNSATPIESTLPEHKEKEGRPLSSSNKESPKPTAVTAECVYAAVNKQSKKNAKAAEATPEDSSKETVEPAQPAHVRLPPAKPISSNGEMHIYVIRNVKLNTTFSAALYTIIE